MPGIWWTVKALSDPVTNPMAMKDKIIYRGYLRGIGCLIWVVLAVGCGKKADIKEDPTVWYTCSMDPQVMEKKPGKCPICKMELTKITLDPHQTSSVHLSEGQEKLANIQTMRAENGNIAREALLNGVVVFNEKQTFQVSARAAGRVEHVYNKSVGSLAKVSEPLYTLYSQMIVASWQELSHGADPDLPIPESGDKNNVLTSIRNRLKYLGISEKVIKMMEDNTMKGTEVPFYPPKNGVVSQVLVKEGDNVLAGQALFEVVDLSRVLAGTR
ncbi:MAG: efflux RND transporter periplasmic adaptor subunit [Cytophagales bacterium]|nr:efflux RND transporter periplasmic adaptor subunit [Cytophagales bacterium]